MSAWTCVCMGVCLHGRVSAWACVCMGVCLHGRVSAWTCVCMDVCLHGRVSAWTCVCMDVCLHGRVSAWTCVCMDVCLHGRVSAWTCVCMDVCLHGRVSAWTCVCMDVLREVSASVVAKSTMWRCSVRSLQLTCRATVKQVDTTFVASTVGHIHPPTVGGAAAANLSRETKEALKTMFSCKKLLIFQQIVF